MSQDASGSSNPADATLVIFCRKPVSGQGKRRLARELGDDATLALSSHLLDATLEDARAWPGPVIIAPAAPEDAAWAATLLPGRATIIPQPGWQPDDNLGRRLNAVDRAARAHGHDALVFIGSDAPALTATHYETVRRDLADAEVVLARARDGGVTIMAARAPWPDLTRLPWSDAAFAGALAQACTEAGLHVTAFDGGFDIDERNDLPRLATALRGDTRPARRRLAAWLRAHGYGDEPANDATVSIVVPVVSDREALTQLLTRLRDMTRQPAEIIVVDGDGGSGGQPARTHADLCARFGCIHLHTRRGRGHQLHAGALRATGELLWFLHADAEPSPDALDAICRHIAGGAIGGWFRFRFAGIDGWGRSTLATLINWRTRIGVPYGDQGLFMTRAAYLETSGFADAPLFEEVPLVRALRRLGPFHMTPTPIGVSPRRWERDGWWRRTWSNRLLALGYTLGISPARLARHYDPDATARPAR